MPSGMKVAHLCYILHCWASKVNCFNSFTIKSWPFTPLVVNIVTNRVVKLLGKDEVVRFLNLTLYQGAPSKKNIITMVGSLFSKISAEFLIVVIGNGSFCKSDSCRQRATRSNTHLHWLQKTTILPLYSIGTRVCISTTFLQFHMIYFSFAETSLVTEMFSMSDLLAMNRVLRPRALVRHALGLHH